MTDERLLAGFRGFDVAVQPDRAFAERLFDQLAADLGFGEAPAGGTPFGRRVVRWIGIERPATKAAALRLGYLAAVLGLLLLGLLAALLVGGLLPRPSAEELVRLSKAAYEDPPAFTMEFRDPSWGTDRLASNGEGTWRIEVAGEPAGSYYLYDGERSARFDAAYQTWGLGPVSVRGGDPWPFTTEFTWRRGEVACDEAAYLGEATVVGRVVDHVACGDIDMEFWLDRSTHLVLRMEPGPTTPGWSTAGPGAFPGMEATSFMVGPQDDVAFQWGGPVDALPEGDPEAVTRVHAGDVPPAWTGRTIDGASFDSTRIATPAVVLFLTTTAGQARMIEAMERAASETPGIATYIAMYTLLGNAVGYLGIHPTSATVVSDPDAEFATRWGITGMPGFVFIDRDGRVARASVGRLEPDEISAAFRALAGGLPLPSATPPPSLEPAPSPPTQTPAPDTNGVTQLETGKPIPAFSGPQLGGGTFESGSLRGQVAFIYSSWTGACVGCGSEDLKGFAETAAALRGRANFVLVASGEETPGWVADQLGDRAGDLPVVMDWDGSVDSRFWLNEMGTLVVDADGTLVAAWPGWPHEAQAAAMIDQLAGVP